MSIQKFSNEELKTLIKLHTQTLFQWASGTPGHASPKVKEAMLDTATRLFEVIEALPVSKGPPQPLPLIEVKK